MPHELKANLEKGYVHLVYSGTVQLNERKEARDAVFQLCHEHGLSRALVDMHNSNIELTSPGVMAFVNAFLQANLPTNYRLACIAKPNDPIEQLVETLLSIDGIDVRYFYSEPEAIIWLRAI